MSSINDLFDGPALQKLTDLMESITFLQQNLNALRESDDGAKRKLIKAATVFQVFLVQALAGGKKPRDLTEEDWKTIAEKVSQYAVMADGRQYSVFVFKMYADYIDTSAGWLKGKASDESVEAIKELAESIRYNTEQLEADALSEPDYIEGCMWISLEAMIKLLASSLTPKIGPEFAYLTQAVAQLSFEYGRLVLLTREQKLLKSSIENQHELDDKLKADYEDYLEDLNKYSEKFRGLIEKAFTPGIHDSLIESANLAKAAGVKEGLLTSIEEVDDFFLN